MEESHHPKEIKETKSVDKEGLEKFIFFLMIVFTIILLFLVYYQLDTWRAENIRTSSDPQELLTSGALACIELGCGPGTNFIGSIEGEVYHECSSSYARSILPINRKCFSSASDATAQGYRISKV